MKPAHESAVNTKAAPGVRRYAHRPRGGVLVLVLAASLAALLPNAAQAHQFGPAGVNNAQINVTPDGYNEPHHPYGQTYEVWGISFIPNNVAHIFQCPTTPTRVGSLQVECQLLGLAPTNHIGAFTAAVYMRDTFSSALHPAGGCRGRDYTNDIGERSFQCSVVAATFAPHAVDGLEATSRAEHYICFAGMFSGTGEHDTKCANRQ